MTTTPVRATSCDLDSTPVPTKTDTAILQKRLLKKNIESTLLLFKFCDLISDVILDLFALEPIQVKEKLNEFKLPYNKVSVAKLLSIRSNAFGIQDLEDIYHSLQLYRTAFSSKQKKWITLNLLEPAEDISFPTDEKVIRHNILQGLRIKGLNAVVKVITYNELIWVMIIEKKLTRRNGMKLLAPIFWCYEIGLPFIFTASKIRGTLMECILRAMKYKNHKSKQLEGKDVKSLLALIKHKSINKSNHLFPYTQQAQVGRGFFDISARKSRESYVSKVFDTKDPITLETFTVKAEAVWRGDLIPEMKGEPFPVTMTLQSKDLVGMLKHMVSTNMVTTPLPAYLQEIVRSAKNQVCMRALGNSNN